MYPYIYLDEAMETEDNDKDGDDDVESHEPVPLLELKRTVFVRMFNPGPQSLDEKVKECEDFLRGSDDSIVLKRLKYGPKETRPKGKHSSSKFNYRLVFSTDAAADEVSLYRNTLF